MLRIQEYLSAFDDPHEGATHLCRRLPIVCMDRWVPMGKTFNESDKTDEHLLVFSAAGDTESEEPIVREAAGYLALYHKDLSIAYWGGMKPLTCSTLDGQTHVNWRRSCAMTFPNGREVIIYNHKGFWKTAYRNSPSGIGELDGRSYWGEQVTKELGRIFNPWPKPFKAYPDDCFVFRLVSEHFFQGGLKFPHIVLVNVIDRANHRERHPKEIEFFASESGIPAPPAHLISGPRSLMSTIKKMWVLAPGVTLKDRESKSIFVANPMLKLLNNAYGAGDRISELHLAKIFKALRGPDDLDKVCLAHPILAEALYLFDTAQSRAWDDLLMLHNTANKTNSAKAFAETIEHHPLHYIIYQYKKGLVSSIKDGVLEMRPQKLIEFAYSQWGKEFKEIMADLKEDLRANAVQNKS